MVNIFCGGELNQCVEELLCEEMFIPEKDDGQPGGDD